MKRIKAIAAVLLLAASTHQAHAQAQNFQGFSVGASFLFDAPSLNATDGTSASKSGTGVAVNGLYTMSLGSKLALGLGGTADVSTRKAGTYVSGVDATTRDRYSFDVVPGLVVNDSYLLFAKLSAVTAQGIADDGSSLTLQGVRYGLGVRGGVSNNYYWQVSYEVIKFRDVNTNSGLTSSFKHGMATLGIGYKF